MNKSIKLLSTILVALLFVPAAAGAQPIPQYQLSIQHPQLIGTAYRFDINLRRVGATPFRLGNSQFILTFNAGQFSSPAISRVGGSEEIGTGFFFDQVISGGKLLISLGGNGSYDAATDIDAGPNGTRISTFEVTGVNVPILSAGLTWVNPPELIRTGLSEIDASDNYRDITDGTGASHINGGGEFARISGYAFNDLNGNGVWDQPSEPGLDGWTIALAGPNGPFMATTGTTPWAQGFFEFVNISPGSYTVTEQVLVGWSQTLLPSNPIVVSASQNSQNNNFGNYNGPAVLGMKFNDLNKNHIRDAGEPGITGWEIVATKIGGGGVKTQLTNGSGTYIFTFLPTESGTWEISETPEAGWVQTFPQSPATYTLSIQSGTYETGIDFGNCHPNSIGGLKFDDLDGSSIKDPGEPGISQWLIRLSKDGIPFDSTHTDGTGGYSFTGLPVGTYVVSESLAAGWIQTLPALGQYTIIFASGGENITGQDFGNFKLGSVSGLVYYDGNHNGSKDPGELGLAHFQVNLTGPGGSQSMFTLPGGGWSFGNLTTGEYEVSEQVPAGYHLTEPLSLTYNFTCTSGGEFTDLKFGNSAAADTTKFRTVNYESIALALDDHGKRGKFVRSKSDKVEFTGIFVNHVDFPPDGLQISFLIRLYENDPEYPLTVTPAPVSVTISNGSRRLTIVYADTIGVGDTVVVHGWGKKGKLQSATYIWKAQGSTLFHNIAYPAGIFHATFTTNRLCYPMPNYLNMINSIYQNTGFGPAGLPVGIQDPSPEPRYGIVLLGNYKSFLRSLYDRSGLHMTNTRGFDVFNNARPFLKIQKQLPPLRQNNRVFADLIALRANIAASQLEIIPPGIGELVFDDGANPLSGNTLEWIASHADSMLLNWRDYSPHDFSKLDTLLMQINEAFQGPIDTTSFVNSLVLTGVGPLQNVPFLRATPGTVPKIVQRISPDQEALPLSYRLYQNFPNPFNPTTTISVDLPYPSVVSLTVYNLLGQEVTTLLDQESLEEGNHEVEFGASSLASGVYFYRLLAKQLTEYGNVTEGQTITLTKKMLLIR